LAIRDPHHKVTVIGNFSGRNAGDAALLEGLLRDVTTEFPNSQLEFRVPTIKPRFVRDAYADFPVRPVGLLPWNLSLKILGVPIFRTVLNADLVLVTDAILFDRKLYNPTFNYLFTLSHVFPLAARRGVPIVLYGVSLGSLSTPAGARCLTRVLESSARVIVRDTDSADLARELHPAGEKPIIAADCALSAIPAPAGRSTLERTGPASRGL
jgi:polysaccharide pyruvyl transferase WcaK-like protein